MLFLFSMVMMHKMGNVFIRTIYFVSGLWHGFLQNMVIVSIAGFFMLGILKFFRINPKTGVLYSLGLSLFILGVLYSLYALYAGLSIITKRIKLKINNLPAEWKNRKIIHISDVHLGSILRANYLKKIISKIEALEPDLILITGDLFDSIEGNLKYYQEDLKGLKAPLGVYFITGNHETYIGIDKVKKALEDTSIKTLNDEMVEIDDLQVLGLAYPGELSFRNISKDLQEIKGFDAKKINILMYHEPRQISDVKEVGVDLMLAGHTHRGQMFPYNFITENIFYGYDHGLYKEENFYLYVSSGAGVWGPTMRTSARNEIVLIEFE